MTATLAEVLVDGPEDVEEFNRWAMENRWSDGLPLLPPTPQRVAQFALAKCSGDDKRKAIE